MDTKPKKILIAEDEKALSKVLQLKLSKEGFVVLVASDGQEVIDILEKEDVDLILLDLVMPKKDGFAVLEALRAKKSAIPIIVASNLSQQEDFDRAKTLGAEGYVIKSETSLEGIIDRIRSSLNS